MILFDNVIEILALANFNTSIIVMIELFNTRFVGSTLININETWLAISVDRLIEES